MAHLALRLGGIAIYKLYSDRRPIVVRACELMLSGWATSFCSQKLRWQLTAVAVAILIKQIDGRPVPQLGLYVYELME